MVIVRLLGGLGNQMFQYAAARRLALAHNVPLKLDISWFAHAADRAYALRALNIQEAFATPEEIGEIRGPSTRGIPRLLFQLVGRLARPAARQPCACPQPLDERCARGRPGRGPGPLDQGESGLGDDRRASRLDLL